MGWIEGLSSGWAYLIVFVVLYISGGGMLIPEEFPLAASGYLVAIGKMSWWGVALNVGTALVLGDLTAYWLGRRYGEKIWSVPPFRWVLTPKRYAWVKSHFEQHQTKALFFSRFFAGIRLVSFVFAGIVRVPVWRFVVVDFAAACLSAPIFIVVAYFFGQLDFAAAREAVGRTNLILMTVVAVILVIFYTFYHFRHKPAPLSMQNLEANPIAKPPAKAESPSV